MKHIIKTLTVAVSISLLSCTRDFKQLNTDPNGISREITEGSPIFVVKNLTGMIENALPIAGNGGYWQLGFDLAGSGWVGYVGTPTPFANNSNNLSYNLTDGWNSQPWENKYLNIMAPDHKIKQLYEKKDNLKLIYAISGIIKVFTMQRVTDTHGPIIYSKYGTEVSEYDSQQSVYNRFFEDLDEYIGLLKAARADQYVLPGGGDITSYNGNIPKWQKFANSLRLRLAMRMSKVDPAKAKEQAEKAINAEEGVIESNADNAIGSASAQPFVALRIPTIEWQDTVMGADIYSFLEGYKDPREGVYFKSIPPKSVDDPLKAHEGKFLATRTGIIIQNKLQRKDFSPLGPAITDTKWLTWMSAAEVFFLRSEGALRGWNMKGTAKELYESGITESFKQYGLSAGEYPKNSKDVPAPFVDVVDAANNIAAVSTITIAWNEADSNELKLERIITQKYLALFPNGAEAWAEKRRTGYPKTFPIRNNTSGGVISTEEGVRRINFVQPERTTNANAVAKAVELLGEESSDPRGDTGATRLWWDIKGKGNF